MVGVVGERLWWVWWVKNGDFWLKGYGCYR